jgi:hypothetical protein
MTPIPSPRARPFTTAAGLASLHRCSRAATGWAAAYMASRCRMPQPTPPKYRAALQAAPAQNADRCDRLQRPRRSLRGRLEDNAVLCRRAGQVPR